MIRITNLILVAGASVPFCASAAHTSAKTVPYQVQEAPFTHTPAFSGGSDAATQGAALRTPIAGDAGIVVATSFIVSGPMPDPASAGYPEIPAISGVITPPLAATGGTAIVLSETSPVNFDLPGSMAIEGQGASPQWGQFPQGTGGPIVNGAESNQNPGSLSWGLAASPLPQTLSTALQSQSAPLPAPVALAGLGCAACVLGIRNRRWNSAGRGG